MCVGGGGAGAGGGGMYTYGVKHVYVVLSAQLCVGGGGVHIRCEA